MTIIGVILFVSIAYVVYNYFACELHVIERKDGEFLHVDFDKHAMRRFFAESGLKPIDLSAVVVRPYFLRIITRCGRVRTVTVPVGYVSDGVSKPLRRVLPIPHDREGGYWVYHDWLYQRQTYDDGTEVTKEDADDIMGQLVMDEVETLWHPYKVFYRLLVGLYKRGDAGYMRALRERGPAVMGHGGEVTFLRK